MHMNHPHIHFLRADFDDCLTQHPLLSFWKRSFTALAVAPRGGAHDDDDGDEEEGVVLAKASSLQCSDLSDFVMVTPLSVR